MKFGFSKLDHVVNRMIRGAIQTGIFPAIFALLDAVTFVKLGHVRCSLFLAPAKLSLICDGSSDWLVRHVCVPCAYQLTFIFGYYS
jgi:thioester reductase-like protein